MRCLISLALLLCLASCDACEDPAGGRVPFKRDTGVTPHQPAHEPEPAGPAFEAVQAQALGPGTREADVAGASVAPPEALGELRAVLAWDLDGDDDDDALALLGRPDGAMALAWARRGPEGFAALEELQAVEGATGCTLNDPSGHTLGPDLATLGAVQGCPDGVTHTVWILGTGTPPRVLEKVQTLPGTAEQGTVDLTLSAADQDEDHFADVLIDLTVTPPDLPPVTAHLVFLNRTGGLSWERAEPAEAIAGLVSQASRALREDPAAGLEQARRALALYAAVCREAGSPRLRFGDAPGLACGRLPPTVTASAVVTAALARLGRFTEALASRAALQARSPSESDLQIVADGWGAAPSASGLSIRRIGTASAPQGPPVRLSALAFRDDGRVLLRGAWPQILDPAGGEVEAGPEGSGDVRLRDPSGHLAVTSIVRRCDGYHLVVVRADTITGAVVDGPPVSEPLLAQAPPAAGCPSEPEPGDDDGGFHVLGWAPQGVVAVRGDELRVVPLTVRGQPAGAPEVLADVAPPSPLAPGASTADGRFHVLVTPEGLILGRTGPRPSTAFLRPEGWADATGPVTDAAVAPDGHKVAFLRGDAVYLIEGIR